MKSHKALINALLVWIQVPGFEPTELDIVLGLEAQITVVDSPLLGESTVLHAITLNSLRNRQMLQAFIKC